MRERGYVAFLRSVVRSVKLLVYFLVAAAELVVTRPQTIEKRADWLHRFCGRVLRGFGVDLKVVGSFPARGALISNHLSYVDIMVYAAMSPVVYCAKGEMEKWPLLGWMATMAGTVFVERGAGGSSERARDGMIAAARAGVPVVFFPEGTTSNGDTLLKFHNGLLSEALAAGQPVTAVYLQYSLTGENGGRRASDEVAFWGEQLMLPHVFRFLSLRGVRAEVRFAGEPIRFPAAASSRKLVAIEARRAVCELGDACRARADEMEPAL